MRERVRAALRFYVDSESVRTEQRTKKNESDNSINYIIILLNFIGTKSTRRENKQ